MIRIRQDFPSLAIKDVAGVVKNALSASKLKHRLKPGMRVGITAGSRGIDNIAIILGEICAYVKALDADPMILAAMGSHGGGNANGQKLVLDSLGITEFNVLAPVIYCADCVEIGRTFYGKLYLNKKAVELDAIIVANRIKPHTSFHGDHESGLLKMLAVGLGGPQGATSYHSCPTELLSRAVAEAGKAIINTFPVALGVAILEDAYDQTCCIAALEPEEIYEKEKHLLNESRQYLPRLPVSELDVLIVDEIGKNFSGTGMDTNIIGRLRITGSPEPELPKINRIVALNVSESSHGNAYGIGLADFTTQRLVDKMDRKAVYLNAITSTFVQRAMIPMTLESDRKAIECALKSLSGKPSGECRIIRIHNTLHLNDMLVSESLLKDLCNLPVISVIGSPEEPGFDSKGNILPF